MHALTHRTSSCFLFELFVAQCILIISSAEHSGKMRCVLIKSDEFENSSHLIHFSQILIMLLLARCARSAAVTNVSIEGCLKKKKHPLSEPSTDRSPLQSLFLGRKSLLHQIWLEHRLPYISFANKMVVDISRFPQKNENKNVKRKITQDATLFKTFYRRKKILKRKKENMNVPREVTPLQLDTS